MADLFRFLLIRAPEEISADDIDLITDGAPDEQPGPLDLQHEERLKGLSAEVVENGGTATAIREAVGSADLDEAGLDADRRSVGRAIARLKLKQQRPSGLTADDLLDLRRRIDLVARAVGARDDDAFISPRPVAIANRVMSGEVDDEGPAEGADVPQDTADDDVGPPNIESDERVLTEIETALDRLARLPFDDIAPPPEEARPATTTQITDQAAGISTWDGGNDGGDALPAQLVLGDAVVDALPLEVAEDVEAVRLSTGAVPLGPLFDRLVDRHSTLTTNQAQGRNADHEVSEAPPPEPLVPTRTVSGSHPDGDARPRPVGVADLLIVRERLIGYEGGDVAHVENVLKSEKRERRTRRLERTEELGLLEQETTTESERDTQSTDRFALNRETNETLRQDSVLKAGVDVTARYGTTVEVNANLDYQSQTSSERSERVATEFSKEVVDRSVQRLSERTREVRSTLRIQEFEDRNSHGFENRGQGVANISGVYQWVNRVNQAQVVNYGRRIMFDIMLPEPAAFYRHANSSAAATGRFRDPGEFNLRPDEITEWNYLTLGQRYSATNLDPPPPLTTAVSKAITEAKEQGTTGLVAKAESIAIPTGYQALSAEWTRTLTYQGLLPYQLFTGITIAGRFNQILTTSGGTITGLAPIQGEIPVVLAAGGVLAISVSVKVLLLRTAAGRASWQSRIHAALYQAYLTQRSDYDRAVAERLASAVQVRGRNPLRNEELIRVELRRAAESALVGRSLPGGPAANPSTPDLYPEIDPGTYAAITPAIRFLEQSFEWDQMVFEFLPYFWASKPGWRAAALLDDTDDLFARFLRAGAVRVAFPVRRNFEAAVLHFLETGTLWREGDPPPVVGERYLPLLKEIEGASEFPPEGVPVGDPWEIRVPTTLVKLRPDDRLPKWKRGEDGEWREISDEQSGDDGKDASDDVDDLDSGDDTV